MPIDETAGPSRSERKRAALEDQSDLWNGKKAKTGELLRRDICDQLTIRKLSMGAGRCTSGGICMQDLPIRELVNPLGAIKSSRQARSLYPGMSEPRGASGEQGTRRRAERRTQETGN